MISSLQGLRTAQTARRSGEWTYSQYPSGRAGDPSTPKPGEQLGDCTDYVRNAVQGTLGTGWAGGDKAGTSDFLNGKAQGFTEVEAGAAQAGDVVVADGHAGIYTGTNSQGESRGLANNGRPSSSPKGYNDGDTGVTTFGPNARYFRPLKPQTP